MIAVPEKKCCRMANLCTGLYRSAAILKYALERARKRALGVSLAMVTAGRRILNSRKAALAYRGSNLAADRSDRLRLKRPKRQEILI